MNLTNQQIQRWAQTFQGHITDYQLVDEGRQGIRLYWTIRNTNSRLFTINTSN